MKILFLNAWEGTTGERLWSYIREQAETTGVFCFMEAGEKFRLKCQELLPNYALISANKKVFHEGGCFQSTYVNKTDKIIKAEAFMEEDPLKGLGLFTQIRGKKGTVNIVSVHGVALPGDKLDDPKRLEQSKIIIDYLAEINGPKLIGGDFNLEPETESVKMFEKGGYRNLIREFEVDTTRNHLSWDLYPSKQLWADYLFVSPEVEVKGFEVPKNEVSDHLPLIIEI